MAKQIFVNVAVKDLKRSKEFFTTLGFTWNPQFTDENAACMIIGENIFAMLLVEKFFKGFIPGKEIANTAKSTEVLLALAFESREKVDDLFRKAIKAGAKEFRETQDYGWMYGRAFQDLDGHIWEVFYMNMEAMPEDMKKKGQKK